MRKASDIIERGFFEGEDFEVISFEEDGRIQVKGKPIEWDLDAEAQGGHQGRCVYG